MSRGWESKSVESQMEEAASRRSSVKPGTPRQTALTPEQLRIQTERESLEMSRKRVLQDLESATHPRRRAQLQAALDHLNRKLSLLTLALVLFLTFLTAASLPAQRRGGGGGRGTPESSFEVRGSVVLPDNVVPHRIVRLEQICAGRPSGLAIADSKGHYSFDLGIFYNPTTGAATPGGRTIASYADCSIRATIEGFRTEAIPIEPAVKSRRSDLPRILLRPVAKDQSVILSATDANIGPAAKKDFERGLDLASAGKWREAIKAMQKATSEEPKFATAWLSLGTLQVAQNQTAEAIKSFTSAIAADEKFATPYIELAVLETGPPQWDKVAEHTGKAISLDPDSFPRAYYLNAMANIRLKNAAAALKASAEGIRVDPDHLYPDLQYMNGVILINTGDPSHGRAQLESYLEIAPNGDNADNARAQLLTAH
jgi:tetratricopeptide (TPR) repeat protein